MKHNIWLEGYGNFVTRYPRRVLSLMALIVGLGALISSQLGIRLNIVELLPNDVPELRGREAMLEAHGGSAELLLSIEGPKDQALHYAKQLVPLLRENPNVSAADVDFPVDFFQDRWLYFLEYSQLQSLQQNLSKVARPADPLTLLMGLARFQKEVDAIPAASKGKKIQRVLQKKNLHSSDGSMLFVLIQPRGSLGDFSGRTEESIHAIQKIIRHTHPQKWGLQTQLGGRMLVMLEENHQTAKDMQNGSLLAFILIPILLTLLTRRFSALMIISVPLLAGIILTLAVTTLTIGRLNMVSGFMIPALAGLGVDFCIHLYLCFTQYLDNGLDRDDAMKKAVIQMAPPCMMAALTTSVAFMALMLNHFDGVSEYGMIASFGVPLTFLSTFVILPPLCLLLPQKRRKKVVWFPSCIWSQKYTFPLVLLGLVILGFSMWHAKDIDFHNDFQDLRGVSEADQVYRKMADALGGPSDPTIFMVKGMEETHRMADIIDKIRSKQNPQMKAQFGFSFSLADIIPTEQQKKRKTMQKIHSSTQLLLQMLQAYPQLNKQFGQKLEELLRASTMPVWESKELPKVFSDRLSSKDGQHHFLYLLKKAELSIDTDIAQWAAAIRKVLSSAQKEKIEISVLDEGVITDRMISLLKADIFPMLTFSFFCVVVITSLSFRRISAIVLVTTSVLAGLIMMLGVMVMINMPLHFFNVVILPSIMGIGIDNAIHIQHGYLQDGDITQVLRKKSPAIFLSTLTTTIGFGVMITAHHGGVFDLGLLAIIGMGCTFFCSSIILPAVLAQLTGYRE